jgi:hypothetical protein
LFIEDGSAKEASHLLFFSRIMWQGQDVTGAGKDETIDMSFEGLKKSEFAVREGNDGVWLVKFDAIYCGDRVDGLGIEAERVQLCQGIARRIGRINREGQKKQDEGEGGTNPHTGSVVTFSIREQVRGEREISRK